MMSELVNLLRAAGHNETLASGELYLAAADCIAELKAENTKLHTRLGEIPYEPMTKTNWSVCEEHEQVYLTNNGFCKDCRIKELEAELKVAQSFHKVAIQQRDAANKRITGLEARLATMEQAYKEGITYGQYKAALGGDDGN